MKIGRKTRTSAQSYATCPHDDTAASKQTLLNHCGAEVAKDLLTVRKHWLGVDAGNVLSKIEYNIP